ncbi:MAG: tetratricopeptide repeat protein [Gammaproteobacteria bacterium]
MTAIRFGMILVGTSWLLVGCVAPNPYYGGPAPVVDRSTLRQPPAHRPSVPNPAIEVNPLDRPAPIVPQVDEARAPVKPKKPKPAPSVAEAPSTESPGNGATNGSGDTAETDKSPNNGKQSNQAVVALLDNAADSVSSGNLDKAASSLERALQIEPRNAGIWHDLGQIRLHQRQYAQAESMASKSNSLAGNSRSLKARNWHLIAYARKAAGNTAGADEAEAQAALLERR